MFHFLSTSLSFTCNVCVFVNAPHVILQYELKLSVLVRKSGQFPLRAAHLLPIEQMQETTGVHFHLALDFYPLHALFCHFVWFWLGSFQNTLHDLRIKHKSMLLCIFMTDFSYFLFNKINVYFSNKKWCPREMGWWVRVFSLKTKGPDLKSLGPT